MPITAADSTTNVSVNSPMVYFLVLYLRIAYTKYTENDPPRAQFSIRANLKPM